jgi:hypothetical protein
MSARNLPGGLDLKESEEVRRVTDGGRGISIFWIKIDVEFGKRIVLTPTTEVANCDEFKWEEL